MDLEELVRTGLAAGTREKARELVVAEVGLICAADADCDPAEVKKTLLSNIGYWAGYCNPAQAQRIYEIFDTEHPIFGRREPTPEEAFARGSLLGYLCSGNVSKEKQEAAEKFVKREDWDGLIEWIGHERK